MRYELTRNLRQRLGNQRESMACIHAKHLLEKIPHKDCFFEARLPEDFNWRKDITVWELEIGSRLADLLRPEYEREQQALEQALES